MLSMRCSAVLAVFLGLLTVAPLHAQSGSSPGPLPCVSNWACYAIRPPLGFYVDTVSEDARYITLEDSTIWEVQIDHRAVVGAWLRDDFVEVRRIAAPTGDYEWLFTKANDREWRAAVRFAGRVRR